MSLVRKTLKERFNVKTTYNSSLYRRSPSRIWNSEEFTPVSLRRNMNVGVPYGPCSRKMRITLSAPWYPYLMVESKVCLAKVGIQIEGRETIAFVFAQSPFFFINVDKYSGVPGMS